MSESIVLFHTEERNEKIPKFQSQMFKSQEMLLTT